MYLVIGLFEFFLGLVPGGKKRENVKFGASSVKSIATKQNPNWIYLYLEERIAFCTSAI